MSIDFFKAILNDPYDVSSTLLLSLSGSSCNVNMTKISGFLPLHLHACFAAASPRAPREIRISLLLKVPFIISAALCF